MAVALTGCVIIKQKEGVSTEVMWKKKCEKCGYVENSTTTSNISNISGASYSNSFICPKCNSRIEIKMQGSKG